MQDLSDATVTKVTFSLISTALGTIQLSFLMTR